MIVDTETFKKRYDVCKKCDNFTGFRCKLCGCVVQVMARLKTGKCKDDRWRNINSNTDTSTTRVP